ncbi:hypothetical protein Dimus_025279 [Dionaea muscipula]
MGFPAVGYRDIYIPKLFIYTLSILGHLRTFTSSLCDLLGFSSSLQQVQSSAGASAGAVDIIVADDDNDHDPTTEFVPFSAALIRVDLLRVTWSSDAVVSAVFAGGEVAPAAESCAVCMDEYELGEEVWRMDVIYQMR